MRRAILESGPCIGAGAPAAEAAGVAASHLIMQKMNIGSLKDMRAATADDIVKASLDSNLTWSSDEWIMPADPGDLFTAGAEGMGTIHADAVMLGSTLVDGHRHRNGDSNIPTTDVALTAFLTKAGLTSDMAAKALSAYKVTSSSTTSEVKAAYGKIRSDTCITCPTVDLGAFLSSIKPVGTIDTFMYRFAGPTGNASMGAEVDSVFGLNVTKNGNYTFNSALSAKMQKYW